MATRIALCCSIAVIAFVGLARADVTLRESTVNWTTYVYELNPEDQSIVPGSFDGKTLVERTYDSLVMENEYLVVTVVPSFGGRVLSMYYKPTGHEELYQNPVGLPYGIGQSTFYYKWLSLWGGIFPTLPTAEHGKSWCLPWEYRIVEQSPKRAAIEMTWQDDIDLPDRGGHLAIYGKTNIKCTFTVSLAAGETTLRTDVLLENPNNHDTPYECWINTGLSPGSKPGDTRLTDGAEMILKAKWCKLPQYSKRLWDVEEPIKRLYQFFFHFDKLKWYKNHPDMGVIYPWPEVSENFWGVINHDNEEGIFRIADNSITPGLKIWTFGYEKSVNIDPATEPNYHRPFLELWAGTSREFFVPAILPARSDLAWSEWYTPSVGMEDVTAASPDLLVNLTTDKPVYTADDKTMQVRCQWFATRPGRAVSFTAAIDDQPAIAIGKPLTPDPAKGNTTTWPMLLDGLTAGEHVLVVRAYNPMSREMLHTVLPFRVDE